MTLDNIIQFILDPVLPGWLLIVKFVFLSLGLFFIFFIVWALIKTTWLKRLIIWDIREIMTFRHYGLVRIERKWIKIRERFVMNTEAEEKLAIIEADNLLDEVLKKMGFMDKTLGEKLDKLTIDILSNLNEVREAHKIRSNIIHDPTFRLDRNEAKKVFKTYEKAMVDLQVL